MRNEEVKIRLLPFALADGPYNMAADETLLLSAARGRPSLRFYGWSVPTLSLGYFQPAQARLKDPLLAKLPWVRRPTGGATLVHHHELTYALALPKDLARPAQSWMARMHQIIAHALEKLGIKERIETTSKAPFSTGHLTTSSEILCFHQQTPGDLLCQHHKILGSAQRKHQQALLQHGGLLLAKSEFTPSLPGLKELTGLTLPLSSLLETLSQSFTELTAWPLSPQTWLAEETFHISQLATSKYSSSAWNEKR